MPQESRTNTARFKPVISIGEQELKQVNGNKRASEKECKEEEKLRNKMKKGRSKF